MNPVELHSRSTLQVLERTLAILALFTRERDEWTTTEASRESGLPIPTVHRIMATLSQHGFLVRDPITKRFRLGWAAVDLGERARAAVDLRRLAMPALARLAEATSETALLTAMNDRHDAAVCLERVESSLELRLSIKPGREVPLHAGASQKVLLAFLPLEEREAVLARPLAKLCRATITDSEFLRGHLDAIRNRGWAISFEENNIGAWGVALPILDANGASVASIGLAGPTARFRRHELATSVRELRLAALEITRALQPAWTPAARPAAAHGPSGGWA
ncbi:MAG TPA: IclR family transcriptional regulator [Gaiellales bacterium]|jgi:DNA-binding IclR family transcriptional regulator|nr:IclR family transcriptional regulator [Gaiellales bacterium]